MTAIQLDRVVLAPVSDLALQTAAVSTGRSDLLEVPGEVRRMANGRLRTVRRAGSKRSLGVTLRMLTTDQVALLQSWAGQTVLLRDVWGRKLYGAYFTVQLVDYKDRSGQDATFTLLEVTFSEAV